jgi:hypothetical protein
VSHVKAIELWRPVHGLEDLFTVSNCGGVRAPDRLVPARVNPQGYRHVSLRGKQFSVHSLVLEAFVCPRPPGMMGLHRDDQKWNNHLGNLYWGSAVDNARDSVRNGTHARVVRVFCPRGHRLAEPNLVQASLPVRICKACNRARGAMRHKYGKVYPEDVMRALADERYAEILATGGKPLKRGPRPKGQDLILFFG